MGDTTSAIGRVRQIQRLLNGLPTREVVLDGLSRATAQVALPRPRSDVAVGLGEVLATRKSHYRFHVEPPGAEELSSLLRWALGPQRTVRLPAGGKQQLRMAPSAGGLPSLAVYVAAKPGGDIPGGVFRYEPEGHCLETLWAGDPTAALRSVLVQPDFAERAPVMVFLVARLDTTLVKYPIRHYRTLHVDSGIAIQNLYLVATALELAACAVTAFDDHMVTQLLRIPDSMFPTVVFPLGRRPD
ncbi:SagB family peptide dehydrogenase [Protofrankia symbiont of Coriaria ruscifolia]|uniref:SagB-type dehydrogenase domain-containing protein n=1 Tax=Candidatus Protofrankia californiensis TaxID=1839754 RepID=A0A1C3NYG9_9ACTN|nr:SagB family peptide dehydrogenase [Protofrankia symbiont of Coriaria ruscifolia]SBW22575.1 SagB-type dehydrogenase domain-containing protein [Candidatus Protofrankia californiensis]